MCDLADRMPSGGAAAKSGKQGKLAIGQFPLYRYWMALNGILALVLALAVALAWASKRNTRTMSRRTAHKQWMHSSVSIERNERKGIVVATMVHAAE